MIGHRQTMLLDRIARAERALLALYELDPDYERTRQWSTVRDFIADIKAEAQGQLIADAEKTAPWD